MASSTVVARKFSICQVNIQKNSAYLREFLKKAGVKYHMIVLHDPFQKGIPGRRIIKSVDDLYKQYYAGSFSMDDFKRSKSLILLQRDPDDKMYVEEITNTAESFNMYHDNLYNFRLSVQFKSNAMVKFYVFTITKENHEIALKQLEEVLKISGHVYLLFICIDRDVPEFDQIKSLKSNTNLCDLSSVQDDVEQYPVYAYCSLVAQRIFPDIDKNLEQVCNCKYQNGISFSLVQKTKNEMQSVV